jgi:metal-dependent amidase/aminoacylase/carboxypeptidase family protein
MFFLGCAPIEGVQRDLHTPIFDLDEACLPIGTAILAQTAGMFLKKNPKLQIDQNLEVEMLGT